MEILSNKSITARTERAKVLIGQVGEDLRLDLQNAEESARILPRIGLTAACLALVLSNEASLPLMGFVNLTGILAEVNRGMASSLRTKLKPFEKFLPYAKGSYNQRVSI